MGNSVGDRVIECMELPIHSELTITHIKAVEVNAEVVPQIIVAGSREYNNYHQFCLTMEILTAGLSDFVVISGKASRGADAMAIMWCREKGIMCREFPADWDLGKSAGYIRNDAMAQAGTHLVAFWDLKSKGTKHMINIAQRYKLISTVIIV